MGNYNLFQICYDENTYLNCALAAFYATDLTEFFENEQIEFLSKGWRFSPDYMGVLSHSFFIKNMIQPKAIVDALDSNEHDVYAFSGGLKIKNVIDTAENYHPGFRDCMEMIVKAIGLDVDLKEDTRMVCYQNAFIARGHIYQDYVDTVLAPAMKVMRDKSNKPLQHILWKDSNYHRKKEPEIRARLIKYLGIDYYPYHPFICERLFSLYMQKNKHITFKHLC